MFLDLIKLICTGAGVKTYPLGATLGYKTPSAFQKVISGQDIRLSLLVTICNALGYTITISNNKGFSININDYYNERVKDNQNGEQ